jgi:hypothetical protein
MRGRIPCRDRKLPSGCHVVVRLLPCRLQHGSAPGHSAATLEAGFARAGQGPRPGPRGLAVTRHIKHVHHCPHETRTPHRASVAVVMSVTPYTYFCLECHVLYIDLRRAGGPGCCFLILDTTCRRCGCFTTFCLTDRTTLDHTCGSQGRQDRPRERWRMAGANYVLAGR